VARAILPYGLLISQLLLAADADLILHNGKVVTADAKFTIAQAVAIKDGRITAIGANDAVLKERGSRTRMVDLGGKTVLPGLIDAHVHAVGAGLSEYKQPLPPLGSIVEIQEYIRAKAKTTPKGEWIVVPRTLPPRLREMRMPTRQDLDVTTDHPVAFDGSYVWSANTKALQVSGITRETPNPPGGEVVKDKNGEPNGILRNAAQLLKGAQRAETFTQQDKLAALEQMLKLYAEAGLTSVGDRAVTPEEVALYEKLHDQKRLPVRVGLTWRINAARPIEKIEQEINASKWKTGLGDDWLRFTTFKVTLDGGQSVGTAYQRMPYGPFGKQLYGQTDPDARGTLFIDPDKLYRIFHAARAKGWQLTAHAQGGGAIDALLDAFERLDKEKSIRGERHHVMHGSMMSEQAIQRIKRLDVSMDVQPGWLYLDAPALKRVFGKQNMRWFFPLHTFLQQGIPVAGGADHMIGHGKDNAVNPFNPFLNMWMCVTRKTREGETFYPEEKVSREDALRIYTNGAAWIQFAEKERGSLEAGKLADLVVIDRDYLTCPEEQIKDIQPLVTMVGGRTVYEKR
jgi:predicted amidohydrolase YtcJ